MSEVVEFSKFLTLVVGLLVSVVFTARSVPVVAVLGLVAATVALAKHGLQQLTYLTDQLSHNRFPVLYWTTLLVVSLPTIFHISRQLKSRRSTVLIRKSFHFLVVAMFGLFIVRGTRSAFLAVAGLSVTACLVLLEAVRVSNVLPPISRVLTQLVKPLLDAKDSEAKVVTSHLELLAAALGPVTLAEIFHISLPREVLLSGLLTVGIGDSFAAIVGTLVTRPLRLPRSSKSVQGALAFVLSVVAALCSVGLLCPASVGATLAAAAVEAWLPNFDNIALPIVFSGVFVALQPISVQ